MPHHAIDPVPVACEIVTAIQVFVTRRIDIFDPVVVTIAKIDGGSTNNVIPEVANLLGTIRTLSEAETDCDARAACVAERAIGELFGAGAWSTMASPIMDAEDFSYVLQRVPGAMLMLGVCPEGQQWKSASPCHSNKMTLNENTLALGVAAHCAVAERVRMHGFDG